MKSILEIYVVPQSSKNEVIGLHDGIPKIKIKAPPHEGKANRNIIEYLSEILELPNRNIEIIRGGKSRRKMIELNGLSKDVAVEKILLQKEKVR